MSNCPVTRAWRILGKPWRLVIIDRLMSGPRTFNQLLYSMPGISSRTLSRALKSLESLKIIEKIQKDGKTYYALTQMGTELGDVVRSVRAWSEKWLMDEGKV